MPRPRILQIVCASAARGLFPAQHFNQHRFPKAEQGRLETYAAGLDRGYAERTRGLVPVEVPEHVVRRLVVEHGPCI